MQARSGPAASRPGGQASHCTLGPSLLISTSGMMTGAQGTSHSLKPVGHRASPGLRRFWGKIFLGAVLLIGPEERGGPGGRPVAAGPPRGSPPLLQNEEGGPRRGDPDGGWALPAGAPPSPGGRPAHLRAAVSLLGRAGQVWRWVGSPECPRSQEPPCARHSGLAEPHAGVPGAWGGAPTKRAAPARPLPAPARLAGALRRGAGGPCGLAPSEARSMARALTWRCCPWCLTEDEKAAARIDQEINRILLEQKKRDRGELKLLLLGESRARGARSGRAAGGQLPAGTGELGTHCLDGETEAQLLVQRCEQRAPRPPPGRPAGCLQEPRVPAPPDSCPAGPARPTSCGVMGREWGAQACLAHLSLSLRGAPLVLGPCHAASWDGLDPGLFWRPISTKSSGPEHGPVALPD